jgi:hypothetical protein
VSASGASGDAAGESKGEWEEPLGEGTARDQRFGSHGRTMAEPPVSSSAKLPWLVNCCSSFTPASIFQKKLQAIK